MPRKLRPDSTFARISPDVKDAVDELLLSGCAYRAAQELLAEYGTSLSIPSIADYYTTHLLPLKWERQARVAASLDSMDPGQLDAATHMAVKQRVWELASSPTPNAKELNTLYSLVLKAETLDQADRKIRLLEDKVAEAKALADQTISQARKGLTDEAITEIQAKLKLL